ncbi:MAG: polyketide cyclase [Moraxellaceae bacterium]|nr:MAG: polyketide cyclase [Moraxellaceae bacterium]
MYSICQKITIEASPGKLYQALTGQEGLCGWWTKTKTIGEVGSIASFLFGPNGEHQVDMKIIALVPNEQVVWKCVSGPWVETGLFTFDIREHDQGCVLRFQHEGWPEMDDFFQHCNAKWGFFFVVSLKSYLETGEGQPHPKDPSI